MNDNILNSNRKRWISINSSMTLCGQNFGFFLRDHTFFFPNEVCNEWIYWIRHIVKTYEINFRYNVFYSWVMTISNIFALNFTTASLCKSSNRFDRSVNDFRFHLLDQSTPFENMVLVLKSRLRSALFITGNSAILPKWSELFFFVDHIGVKEIDSAIDSWF